MKPVTALGLFSGGLDSILASRVIAAQGIRVVALKFVTPFFHDELLRREESYRREVEAKYNLDVRLVDLGEEYVELLRNPQHGFGKNFNPCIDCKIFMLRRARTLMEGYGASFLFTGEVLGQRPMSQRRDTLRVIERESGCEDILLRPLCARFMKETRPEREGLVDREQLHGFSGRGRKQQIMLAARFGITDFPAPAGGCVLTDPNLAGRIEKFYTGYFATDKNQLRINDIRLLLFGRHFRLPGGSWLILGRTERENETLRTLGEKGDWFFEMTSRPGPLALIRRAAETVVCRNAEEETLLRQAAGLVVRYGKKEKGLITPSHVSVDKGASGRHFLTAEPLADEEFRDWQI